MSDVERDPTSTGGPPGEAPAVPASEMQAASGPSGPRSGFWTRFGAWLVDFLVLLVPSVAVTLILGNTAAANAITTLIGLAYYVYFEGGPTGQTIGKRTLGIRVIDLRAGGSIGYGRAVVRYIVRFFSGIVLLIGYLWMIWDREKQTWHDKAATSVVVPVEAYPIQTP